MNNTVYSNDTIAETVRPLLKKYHAKQAILFGSYARKEADSHSDIDLLIIGGEEFEPTDTFCVAEDLYRLLGKNVDVYEQREINRGSGLYQKIFSEGVRIE